MPENMIGSSASVLICSYVLYIRTDCVVSIIIYLPTFPIVTLMLNLYVLVISYLDHGQARQDARNVLVVHKASVNQLTTLALPACARSPFLITRFAFLNHPAGCSCACVITLSRTRGIEKSEMAMATVVSSRRPLDPLGASSRQRKKQRCRQINRRSRRLELTGLVTCEGLCLGTRKSGQILQHAVVLFICGKYCPTMT